MRRTGMLAVLLVSGLVGLAAGPVWPASPAAAAAVAQAAPTREDSARALHLLRRATFGVRPEDLAQVLEIGRDAWLDRQLRPKGVPDTALASRLAAFPLASAEPDELLRDFLPPRRPAGDTVMTAQERQQRRQTNPQRILTDLVGAKLVRSVWSERQLEEVMTDFWFNHFNVVFTKGLDRFLIGDYERRAIRPHVFGRFEDMLRATARHPAMLFYLDNWTSSVQRGINENYARELLELHTLGVDGGYTQQDVIEVARAFTGWTIVRPGQRGRRGGAVGAPGAAGVPDIDFRFVPPMHDRGEKVVLGHRLPAGGGISDGEDVIRIVARHPSTARHIATKLIERFVSDTPDSAFVAELAAVFTRTDGDLREVTRALFSSPRFYEAANMGAKIKTPFELVASALRVTRAEIAPSRQLHGMLRSMGQLPYTETAPTGFPAASEEWVNSAAMLARMNFALALASGQLSGVRPVMRDAARPPAGDATTAVDRLLAELLPGVQADELAAAIREDLREQVAAGTTGRRMLGARAVGLALGSPEFQRR